MIAAGFQTGFVYGFLAGALIVLLAVAGALKRLLGVRL